MGNSQSKQVEIDVPRRPQNRLSKPRTFTSTSLNGSSAASHRDSRLVLPLPVPDEQQGLVPLDSSVAESGGRSRRSSLSTRQRLRDHLFRSKSSDGRGPASSITTKEDTARDATVDRWLHSRRFHGQSQGEEHLPEPERQPPSRPTSRRSSTAYTPYSHHASRLSLVAEANTPEPNMIEASQKLEELSQRALTDRSNSDASVIPMRRRSILMTPGVATRRDSNGELLYESFPVSRRLSTAGTLGSRRNSWFDQLNPDMSYFAELPAVAPLILPPLNYEDAPRAVTPSDQEFALGYKLGTLRITNADSHDVNQNEEGPVSVSIEVPLKPTRPQIIIANGESSGESLELAQECQQDLDSLSPFSFEKSRSPSPQLQTTSKNTAVEDELFEDDPEVAIGSPEHALRILDGTANSNPIKPSVQNSSIAPVRVPNSYESLDIAVQGSKEMPYKPLTKNDSGYSSNVSLRSFKAKAEARAAAAAAAAKSNDREGSEDQLLHNSEARRSSNIEVSPLSLNSHSVSLATINAPPPLPEKSLEQKMAAAALSQSQSVESNKQWSFRPSLTINRKPSNASPKEADSPSTMSPSSLIRRLTKGRPSSQPIVAVTSDHKVDCQIPPVSASASARLEERQREYPTLSHTYKSTSRTNSRETLTTIMSMSEAADVPAVKRSPLVGGNAVAPPCQDKNSYSPFSSTSLEERSKGKTLQRNASRDQSQADFEAHITSFGTVSESLGASPYDLAVSAMTPRKRSQSFHNLTTDRLSNANRSHSAHDLAPHSISSINAKARKGMDASTASQLAREKSRDREIGHRASLEKVRDDRTALPSNRSTMRASMSPVHSPMHSRPSISKPSRTPPQPPVTMSAYRKSLPVQPQELTRFTGLKSGPAASSNGVTYGPWQPRRPQVMHRQSANDVMHVNDNHKTSTRRPSFEFTRKHSDWSHNGPFNGPYNNNFSSTKNGNSYINSGRVSYSPLLAPQVIDRYNGGLAYEYEAEHELGGSVGTWAGNRRRTVDAGSVMHYGVDFSDVPVMQRVRQEA